MSTNEKYEVEQSQLGFNDRRPLARLGTIQHLADFQTSQRHPNVQPVEHYQRFSIRNAYGSDRIAVETRSFDR